MKKYEIVRREIETRNKSAIQPGCTVDIPAAMMAKGRSYSEDPEILNSFDSLDEAEEALADFTSDIRELSDAVGRYYLVTECMIEENEYDDDGEWYSGGDDLAFSHMPTLGNDKKD